MTMTECFLFHELYRVNIRSWDDKISVVSVFTEDVSKS